MNNDIIRFLVDWGAIFGFLFLPFVIFYKLHQRTKKEVSTPNLNTYLKIEGKGLSIGIPTFKAQNISEEEIERMLESILSKEIGFNIEIKENSDNHKQLTIKEKKA